jgi:hypothetical protein
MKSTPEIEAAFWKEEADKWKNLAMRLLGEHAPKKLYPDEKRDDEQSV